MLRRVLEVRVQAMILEPFYVLTIVLTGATLRIDGGWDSCMVEQQRLYPQVTTCQQWIAGKPVGPAEPLPAQFRPQR